MAPVKRILLIAVLRLFVLTSTGAVARHRPYQLVRGCDLLLHPNQYNSHVVKVSGLYVSGMEQAYLKFKCSGAIDVSLSLTPNERKKYGFLTDRKSIRRMDKAFQDVLTYQLITGNIYVTVPVTVVGFYRCHYDFPNCDGATRSDGSIVIQSIRLLASVKVHQVK